MSESLPWPGDEPAPPADLPPAKYAIGDRVVSKWGAATVVAVLDSDWFGSRCYRIKHDWSQSPPDFGHHFGEDQLKPGLPREYLERIYSEDHIEPAVAEQPPRFKVGDRVQHKWGPGTVVHVYSKHRDYDRRYRVVFDSRGGSPESGNGVSEREIEAESPQRELF